MSTAELARLLRAELLSSKAGLAVVGGRSDGLAFEQALARRIMERFGSTEHASYTDKMGEQQRALAEKLEAINVRLLPPPPRGSRAPEHHRGSRGNVMTWPLENDMPHWKSKTKHMLSGGRPQ